MKENGNLTNCVVCIYSVLMELSHILGFVSPTLYPFAPLLQVKVFHRCITLDHVGNTMPWCWSSLALAWRICLTSVTELSL